jgi:hypothetical protein
MTSTNHVNLYRQPLKDANWLTTTIGEMAFAIPSTGQTASGYGLIRNTCSRRITFGKPAPKNAPLTLFSRTTAKRASFLNGAIMPATTRAPMRMIMSQVSSSITPSPIRPSAM